MGNLVSSCGSHESSPSSPSPKNNSKNTNTRINIAPVPVPVNTNKKANTAPANTPVNTNTKATTPAAAKEIRFGNTNTRNIKNINTQMKKMPKPNLTKTPEASALKPNTRTPQEKAEGVNPNENVLINSVGKALVKGAKQGMKPEKQNVDQLFSSEENEQNIETLLKLTKPPSKSGASAENLGNPTTGENMAGGRRRKSRKQRKHRK